MVTTFGRTPRLQNFATFAPLQRYIFDERGAGGSLS